MSQDQKQIETGRLYVLMRTDMASMNAGKAVAQGGHAVTVALMQGYESPRHREELMAWSRETVQRFGTKITLGVNEAQMRSAVKAAQDLGLNAQIIHDPEYPLIDGDVVHLIPLDTCGYVFGTKSQVEHILGPLPLMP